MPKRPIGSESNEDILSLIRIPVPDVLAGADAGFHEGWGYIIETLMQHAFSLSACAVAPFTKAYGYSTGKNMHLKRSGVSAAATLWVALPNAMTATRRGLRS